jgi:hypothetical protein
MYVNARLTVSRSWEDVCLMVRDNLQFTTRKVMNCRLRVADSDQTCAESEI